MIPLTAQIENVAPELTQTQKLERHFLELNHFYQTMQNERGDKLFDNIKKAYNFTYSELNGLYKEFNKNVKIGK